MEAATAERRQVESQLQDARQEASHAQIEADRVKELLDSANSKVSRGEQGGRCFSEQRLCDVLVYRKE